MNMTSHALGANTFSYSGLPNWSRISLDLRFFVFLMRVPRNCQVEQTGWLALVISIIPPWAIMQMGKKINACYTDP